jgi:hypothetical protein
MINTEEQKQKDNHNLSAQLSSSIPIKRYPIVCKFWMMGNCLKEEKCEYLHSEREKRGLSYNRSIVDNDTECPMYSLGFCKNGSMCNYKHTERKIDPVELESMPELPIWYLEYVMEKPISLIFQEFEEQNKEEAEALVKKFKDIKQHNKQIKMKSSKLLPVPAYQINSVNPKYSQVNHYNYLTGHQAYDIYSEKKDFIIRSLEKKVRYFFIRNINMNYVKLAMEYNCLINIKQNSIKLKEAQKSCDEVILIIFDEQNFNFNGFCKFKKELTEKDIEYHSILNNPLMSDFNINFNTSYLKIEWHWKTKLSYDKVEIIKNPLNDDELLIDSRDCQEISMDVGNYICRLMIKRLSKNEVKEYLEKRRLYDDKNISKSSEKLVNTTASSTNLKNINLNKLIFEEISKKNLNQSLVFQTGNSNNCTNDSVNNNNIIVTNISNLQVNISQNSYQSSSNYLKSREADRIKKKKNHSKSRSREPAYVKSKKDRKRTRSRSYKSSDKKKRHKRKYSNENDKNYDSDETVILKEESSGTGDNFTSKNSPVTDSPHLLSKKPKVDDFNEIIYKSNRLEYNKCDPHSYENSSTPLESASKYSDNKMIKNSLFSNAMKKIAMQSSKSK